MLKVNLKVKKNSLFDRYNYTQQKMLPSDVLEEMEQEF